MFRRRRIFLFISAFLSLYDGFVAQETLPVLPETSANFKGPTLQPANLRPNLLSAAHRLFNGFQRPLPEITAPPLISKPPVVTIAPSYQQDPVNVNPAPNLPFTQRAYNTGTSVTYTPEILPVEAVEMQPLEYSTAIDQNVPLGSTPFGQIPQTPLSPEALYAPNLATQPSFSQFYQSPITVQAASPVITPTAGFIHSVPNFFSQNNFAASYGELAPAVYPETVNTPQITESISPIEDIPVDYGSGINYGPVITPSAGFIQSAPSFFPQNNFAASYGELVPSFYPETVNTPQITESISPIEAVPVDFGSCIHYGQGYPIPQSLINTPQIIGSLTPLETTPVGFGSGIDSRPGYQLPLSLQINMPSPAQDQPIIFLSPPTQSASSIQDTSYVSPIPPMVPPQPLIVIEGSRSKWKSLLPILLLGLCDGGCQNSGNSGCCNNIPIPYPIPIPTNNPIILSGGGKVKKPAIDDGDNDVVWGEVFQRGNT